MIDLQAAADPTMTFDGIDTLITQDFQIVPVNDSNTNAAAQNAEAGTYKRTLGVLQDVFMPAGYPSSVSSDYLNYQIFDSLQAFSSSIAGLLASRAVLEGFGVGDASASATTALLINIAQDAISRIATILFAWRLGTSLEPESKKYRLLADIFNDTSMILDCFSPLLPSKSIRVFILCTSGAFRALCGVAAGGAKAALSIHFAKANNVGDLNAKDSSQETVIGLLGMLAGSFVIKRVTTPITTWTLLVTLLAMHLFMNYLAVRSVTMHTLNRQRLTLAYSTFRRPHHHKDVQTPTQIAKRESIFARGGRLYDHAPSTDNVYLGHCTFESFKGFERFPSSLLGVPRLLRIFSNERYITTCVVNGRGSSRIRIYIHEDATPEDILRAWIHAVELAYLVRERRKRSPAFTFSPDDMIDVTEETYRTILQTHSSFFEALKKKGWDMESNSLLTGRVTRFRTVSSDTRGTETKKDI